MNILSSITIIQVILYLLLVFVLQQAYKYVLAPYLKVIRKRREIQGKYSFFQYPFIPYGLSFMLRLNSDFNKFGDSMFLRKNVLPKKDLALSLMKDQLLLTLIDQKLINDYVQRQKQGCYVKTSGIHLSSLFQILGSGLLFSQGEEWRYKRKVMSTLFNFQFIKTKVKNIIDISKEMCEQAKATKNEKGQVRFKVDRLFQRTFGTVVIRCFFGDIKLQPINNNNIFDFLSDLLQKIAKRNYMVSSFIFGPALRQLGIRKIDRQINNQIQLFRKYMQATINQIIQCVESNTMPQDSQGLIAKLMRNKRLVKDCPLQQKIEQGYYTYQDLINEMSTFFFGGTDTTSKLIASLAQSHKQVEEKLRDQIKQVLNDDIGNINMQSIKKMTYLKNVQQQTLRMMTPVPYVLPRVALKDNKIGDINIQKGTIIIIESLANHYRQEVYERPMQFNPQRWVQLQKQLNHTSSYFPFSLGLRTCIGQQLALIESRIALVIFLLNFKNGRELQPLRNKLNVTYGPQNMEVLFDCL